MRALKGVAVLVTRPAKQAMRLCQLFESAGASVIRLPVMEIHAVEDRETLQGSLGPTDSFDLVIFTSANAVTFGAPLLTGNGIGMATFAAIGPATARALEEAGLKATTSPAAGFDSENLLLHPALTQVHGRRVLIVTGRQGRQFLREQLVLRGAQVVVAEVYQRVCAVHTPTDLAALEGRLTAHAMRVITATSAEIAACLYELSPPPLRLALDHAHWLVPGERVAAAVRALGVTAPLLQAASAADQDLAAAVLAWRSSESGA